MKQILKLVLDGLISGNEGTYDFFVGNGTKRRSSQNFRYGVGQKKACGESAAVNDEDCESWKSNVLPGLLENYEERNVFNADETGLFF